MNKELRKERAKLNQMIEKAMQDNKFILNDKEIIKQSSKVDDLIAKIQNEKVKKNRKRGDSR